MKAPTRLSYAGQFFQHSDGKKVFRQVDDELLAAVELDAQAMESALTGMLCARIREAEKDRDAAESDASSLRKQISAIDDRYRENLVAAIKKMREQFTQILGDLGVA